MTSCHASKKGDSNSLVCAIFCNCLFHSETWFRFHLMFVGREWQGMFVEAREKVVKSINLTKCVKRDIEKWPVFDQDLLASLKSLKVISLQINIILD